MSSSLNIYHEIQRLGFEGKEAIVLGTMFEIGVATITAISTKAGLPRQTTYYIIESLLKEKIIAETRELKDRVFFTNTKLLTAYYHRRESVCKDAKQRLRALNIKLRHIKGKNTNEHLPYIEYYRGKMGLENLLEEILATARNKHHTEFRAYALSKLYPGLEESMRQFIIQRDMLGIKSKIIVPLETDFNSILGEHRYGREFRRLAIKDIGATLYIIGDRSYIFSYKDNVGIMIENETIAQFLASIFENHWSFLSQK